MHVKCNSKDLTYGHDDEVILVAIRAYICQNVQMYKRTLAKTLDPGSKFQDLVLPSSIRYTDTRLPDGNANKYIKRDRATSIH